MEKLDFALSLIRSPFWKRISDRTFLQSVGAAVTALGGVVAIWRTEGVPTDQKVNVTMAALGAVATVVSVWNASEKRKDTEIAKAVLASVAPETLNAGTVVTAPAISASSLSEAAQAAALGLGERLIFGKQVEASEADEEAVESE